jgi:DNA polymerase III alpha subunit (gram-positive type)
MRRWYSQFPTEVLTVVFLQVEIKLEDLLAEEETEDTEIFDVEIEHRQSEVEEMAEKMDQIMLVVIPYIEKQIVSTSLFQRI